MRIAQVAPLYESVPPKLYGGTERVVFHLTNQLASRGHEITLYASGDSRTNARLVPARPRALRLDDGLKCQISSTLAMLEKLRDDADDFDLIHFHVDCLHMPLFEAMRHKTLTTLHGRLDIPDLQTFMRRHPRFPLVSISNSQRRPLPELNWMGTVHHGYPLAFYPFNPRRPQGYLAFLGRICPEKGVDTAIEIAKRAGIPLRIAAKIDAADTAYFQDVIRPALDHPLIDFVGEICDEQKADFLGEALALLCPITWPEPFGLVIIEAMATGTPVIAFDQGSASELIENGVTGFVAQNAESMLAAIDRTGNLDRQIVRQRFEERFSVARMADKYEAIYARLVPAETHRQDQYPELVA